MSPSKRQKSSKKKKRSTAPGPGATDSSTANATASEQDDPNDPGSRSHTKGLSEHLFVPVDGASTNLFRVVFGVVMGWSSLQIALGDSIENRFLIAKTQFKFSGFEWVTLLPESGLRAAAWILVFSALGIALGRFSRICAGAFAVAYGYFLMVEKAHYNNHDYLIFLLACLLVVVPEPRRSKAWGAGAIPGWALWLLRFQIAVPYFFGAIAKINWDWLVRAEPMTTWLRSGGADDFGFAWLRSTASAQFFSWSGFLLDLLVVPALLWRRTRIPAYILITMFHLINSQIFSIGVFPWLMIGATTLFFDPSWPRRLKLAAGSFEPRTVRLGETQRLVGTALLALWVGVQCLLPLRHWLYPGPVDWTEEGHTFAWRMKIRDKSGELQFLLVESDGTRTIVQDAERMFTKVQREMMRHDPQMIRQAAHYLAERLEEAGRRGFEVRVLSSISFNGRPRQQFIDPESNLLSFDENDSARNWIVPLQPAP